MDARNYGAVYEVTRGLRMLLRSQLKDVVENPVVSLVPPGETLPEGSGVNLYLYRVDESAMTRNAPWPGDRHTPPGTRPALGLVLSYLLTPLGKEQADSDAGDDAHTMLGAAMMTFAENPVLTRTHIPGFDADTVFPQYILDSYETVKIALQQTTLDELSKIWSTINKPYRLSVSYEVSLVELTPSRPPQAGGGIVQTTGVTVVPIMMPAIAEVVPATSALARLADGAIVANEITLQGSGFAAPGRQAVVTIGGTRATVKTTPAPTNETLTVILPTSLNAGPDVDVVVSAGGRESIAATLAVAPWLARIVPVRTALDPAIGDADTRLVLTGSGLLAPSEVRFIPRTGSTKTSSVFDAGGTAERQVVAMPSDLANGTHEIRVIRVVLGEAWSTNARTLQVVPRVSAVTASLASPPASHELTVDGARLAGAEVRVVIDAVSHGGDENTNDAQLVLKLGRRLDPGTYEIAVDVDGNVSRPFALEIAP